LDVDTKKEPPLFSLRKAAWSVLAGAMAILTFGPAPAGAAVATIPFGQNQVGIATFYNDAGYGACGTPINAATEMLVAVSYQWFTTANPNNDPLCTGVSVQVTYNGKTITVPVKDKCPSCDATHIDLSQAAFGQFASTDPTTTPGVLNVTWQFVSTNGNGGTTPPPPAPSPAYCPCTSAGAPRPTAPGSRSTTATARAHSNGPIRPPASW
jgi:hypothetical protein